MAGKFIFCVLTLTIPTMQLGENNFMAGELCSDKEFGKFKILYNPTLSTNSSTHAIGKHKLGLVVPFRDRFEELLDFVPAISKYLNVKNIDFKIYVVNQIDNFRFNRASLINVGFLESMTECDYMAMHDVDLIPLNTELNYGYPVEGPYHVAAPWLHPNYNYKDFIGGILIINKKQFLKVNGMSNKFWGWGREDDEFFMRLNESNYKIFRIDRKSITTDSTNTFMHNHSKIKRKRDTVKTNKQKQDGLGRDRYTGLDTIQYRMVKRVPLLIDDYPCTVLNVELFCDKMFTPWCEHQYEFL